MKKVARGATGGVIFAKQVRDPKRYGIVEIDRETEEVISIEEKPHDPKSDLAVPGLYFYDNDVVELARNITPSDRGELEITTINQAYLQARKLKAYPLPRGSAWYDCGTVDSLSRASNFIQSMEIDHDLLVGSPEEVAWRKKFISSEQLERLAEPLTKSGYGQQLLRLLKK